jgi:hypothetical protein
MAEKLTDRTLLAANVDKDADLLHIVDVSDTTDSADGSSFKATPKKIINSYVSNGSENNGETLYFRASSGKFLPSDIVFIDDVNTIAFFKKKKATLGLTHSGGGNSTYAGAFALTKDNILRLNLSANDAHDLEIFTDTTTSNGYIGVRGNLQFLHVLQGKFLEYSTTDSEAGGTGILINNNKMRINETLKLVQGLIAPASADSCAGEATLVSGQVTISHNEVQATSRIFVSYKTPSGTLGTHLVALGADVVGATRFEIKSIDTAGAVVTTDNSVVNWFLVRSV